MDDENTEPHRPRRAMLVVALLAVLGFGGPTFIVGVGLEPIWGVIVFLSTAAMGVLGWLLLRDGLDEDQLEDPDDLA